MRHIKTICNSDSYLIHHHGGLQVNTCTVLQQLAFNLASEFICDEECTKLTLRSCIHKQGPVQQRVDGLLKYNTNVCTYLVLFICHHNVKRLFGKHDFNYHNTQTCKAHAYFGTCLPLSRHRLKHKFSQSNYSAEESTVGIEVSSPTNWLPLPSSSRGRKRGRKMGKDWT